MEGAFDDHVEWEKSLATETAFQNGYDAYWNGVDSDDNPYLCDTEEHFVWDEGWSQAQLEDDEAVVE